MSTQIQSIYKYYCKLAGRSFNLWSDSGFGPMRLPVLRPSGSATRNPSCYHATASQRANASFLVD